MIQEKCQKIKSMKLFETKVVQIPSIEPILTKHNITLCKSYAHPEEVPRTDSKKIQPDVSPLDRFATIVDKKSEEKSIKGAIFIANQKNNDFTTGFWVNVSSKDFLSAQLGDRNTSSTTSPIVYQTWRAIEDGWLYLDHACVLPKTRLYLDVLVSTPAACPSSAFQLDYVFSEETRLVLTQPSLPSAEHRLILGAAHSGTTTRVQQMILEQKRGTPISIITSQRPWGLPQVNLTPCLQDLHFFESWEDYILQPISIPSILIYEDCINVKNNKRLEEMVTKRQGVQVWLVVQSVHQVPPSIRHNCQVFTFQN